MKTEFKQTIEQSHLFFYNISTNSYLTITEKIIMKILIVEDTDKLLEHIESELMNESFLCETAKNYREGQEKIAMYQYDVLVVDINLPDGSGLDLIKEMKSFHPSTGIIVISARDSIDNKIQGLELGADDYLTKPFAVAELIARIKSLSRRRNFSGQMNINYCGANIDIESRSVSINSQPIKMTKSEYDILLFFISNPNRVLTKENIAEHIWGDNMDLADSFDFIYSHIKNIRKKFLENGGKNPFQVVYGIGYKTNNES